MDFENPNPLIPGRTSKGIVAEVDTLSVGRCTMAHPHLSVFQGKK
jgi:hypothetical protein